MVPFFGSSIWLLTLPKIKEMDMTTEMTELESVKEIALNMDIKVGNTKDVEKIKAMIAEKSAPKDKVSESTKAKQLRRYGALRKESMKLVRVRIVAMSPFERQMKNTLVDVGSAKLGQVKRVIPFNTIWHVEKIILDALRDRKFRTKQEHTDPQTRRKVYTNVFSPSYGIEVFPDLTAEELAKLSADQRARNAID